MMNHFSKFDVLIYKFIVFISEIIPGLLMFALGFGLFYFLASEFSRQSGTIIDQQVKYLIAVTASAVWTFIGDFGLQIEERRKEQLK